MRGMSRDKGFIGNLLRTNLHVKQKDVEAI